MPRGFVGGCGYLHCMEFPWDFLSQWALLSDRQQVSSERAGEGRWWEGGRREPDLPLASYIYGISHGFPYELTPGRVTVPISFENE